MARWVGAQSQ